MHPINRILSTVGLQVHTIPAGAGQKEKAAWDQFESEYAVLESAARQATRSFSLFTHPVLTDMGEHPVGYHDYECAFAAAELARLNPKQLLDIGSYRLFILGLLSHFPVTTLDVRPRAAMSPKETVLTGTATEIPLPSGSMDAVVSLCSIEHIGLGRYGDPFDFDGDLHMANAVARVLKVGGHFVFSTTLTQGKRSIAFNAHRIYRHEDIQAMLPGFECAEEKFFSRKTGFVPLSQITREEKDYDIYMGSWKKVR